MKHIAFPSNELIFSSGSQPRLLEPRTVLIIVSAALNNPLKINHFQFQMFYTVYVNFMELFFILMEDKCYYYKNHSKRVKAQQSVSSLRLIRCHCNRMQIESAKKICKLILLSQ